MRPSGSHERRKPLARTRAARVHSPPSLSSATPVLKSSLKHERKGSSRTSKHVVEDPPSSSPALNLNLEDASFGSQADGSSSAVPLVRLEKLLALIERIDKWTLEEASAIDDLTFIGIGLGLQDIQASGEGSSGTIKHVVEDASAIDDLKGWFLKFERRLATFMQVQKAVVLSMRKMEADMCASKQAPSGPQYDIRNRVLFKMNIVLARLTATFWARLQALEEMEKHLAFKLAASSSGSFSGDGSSFAVQPLVELEKLLAQAERFEKLTLEEDASAIDDLKGSGIGIGLQDNQTSGEGSSGSIKHVVEDASAIDDLKGWLLRSKGHLAKLMQVQRTFELIMRKMEADTYVFKQAPSEPQYHSGNGLLLKINLVLTRLTAALWPRLHAVEEMVECLTFKLAASASATGGGENGKNPNQESTI